MKRKEKQLAVYLRMDFFWKYFQLIEVLKIRRNVPSTTPKMIRYRKSPMWAAYAPTKKITSIITR